MKNTELCIKQKKLWDMLFLFIKFPCHFCTEMIWCNQLKMPRKQEGDSMWCHWRKINCRSDAPKARPGRCVSILCQKLEIKCQSLSLKWQIWTDSDICSPSHQSQKHQLGSEHFARNTSYRVKNKTCQIARMNEEGVLKR